MTGFLFTNPRLPVDVEEDVDGEHKQCALALPLYVCQPHLRHEDDELEPALRFPLTVHEEDVAEAEGTSRRRAATACSTLVWSSETPEF